MTNMEGKICLITGGTNVVSWICATNDPALPPYGVMSSTDLTGPWGLASGSVPRHAPTTPPCWSANRG